MIRFKVLILTFIFSSVLLTGCTFHNGVVVDKFEGENKHYILLDTNEWIPVSPEDYIGLDIGDFYEDN